MKDKGRRTNPPANQTSAITNEITIVVGSGPETRRSPTSRTRPFDLAKQNLTAYGFPNAHPERVDSTEPEGQVVGTNPPAGRRFRRHDDRAAGVEGQPVRDADLTGQFWTDAEPRLRALGWTGGLDKGADVQNSGQRTNAVVSQSPSPGTGVNFDSTITLRFAS